MSRLLLAHGHRLGRFHTGSFAIPAPVVGIGGGGGGGGALPNANYGPRANDWFLNKTSGGGGHYVTGDVWMPAGVYYWDPIDLTPGAGYHRAFDATKPYNNNLRIREWDGPGTVIFDHRPESAAAYRSGTGAGGHQTQTEAYNDTTHGGAMRNVPGTAGSLRWWFDGAQKFNGPIHFTAARTYGDGATTNGSDIFNSASLAADSSLEGHVLTGWSIPAGTTILHVISPTQVQMSAPATGTGGGIFGFVSSVDRLGFHGGTQHTAPIAEWRREFDIIRVLRGVADPGASIPDTQTYRDVWGDSRFAGCEFPCAFRLEGVTHFSILRADIAHCGDDGIFTGAGTAFFTVVGTAASYVVNNDGGYQGPGPAAWFHNDCWQYTGTMSDVLFCDSTLQGHGFEAVAEVGQVRRVVIDRVHQGIAGADGGDFGGSGYTQDSSVQVGTGAPTTRVSGHYFRGFSNGTDHRDGDPQVAYQLGNTSWHASLVDIGGHSAILTNFSVTVPAGVTVGADGMVSPTGMTAAISAFMASSTAPHVVFRVAYATTDIVAVQADYGNGMGFN